MIKFKIKKVVYSVFLVFMLLSSNAISFGKDKNEIIKNLAWYTSLEEGLIIAKKENKFLLLDFSASWCSACKELEEHTYKDKNVIQKLNESFIKVKIDLSNISNINEIISTYSITSLPTIIFFDKNSKYINNSRLIGFTKPDDFIEILNKVQNDE